MIDDQRITQPMRTAIDAFRQAVEREGLSRPARVLVAEVARREIVPRRTPGRKNERMDLAYADYRAGMRGLDLYRKHIPNFAKLSRWRRIVEQSRLSNTLRKRSERERKKLLTHDNSAERIVTGQPAPPNGHADNDS